MEAAAELREPEQHGPVSVLLPEQARLEPQPPGPEQMLPEPVAQQELVLQALAASLPAEQLVPLPGLA